jgi:RNA polymerase sigma factor
MRRLEIEQLRKELSEWGINFFELAACSPKHKKTQKICNDIVGFLLSDPGLMKGIRSSNQLPVSEIEKGLRIPRKIVERFRKYIISVLLVETGDYQYIKEYAAFK